MKKKTISIVILFILNLSFAACGINNDLPPTASSEVSAETLIETPSESEEIIDIDTGNGFVFVHEGHEFYMGMPEEEIQQLDGYDLVSGNGIPEVIDNRYKFKGFFVECSKRFLSNNAMVVSMIYFIDNSVETAEGIRLGDSLEKVQNAYIEDKLIFETESLYRYSRANSVLTICFRDNKVSEILYTLNEQ